MTAMDFNPQDLVMQVPGTGSKGKFCSARQQSLLAFSDKLLPAPLIPINWSVNRFASPHSTMKLYWSPRSPYVRKVMVCAHETGLADRIEPVLAVVAMTRPHLELMRENPLGKIPTLVTDSGRVLFDSAVICEYLDSLHAGARLFPSAPERR